MNETRLLIVRMDAPNTFPSERDFKKNFYEMLPGDFHGKPKSLELFPQDGTNIRDNMVTVRVCVEEID